MKTTPKLSDWPIAVRMQQEMVAKLELHRHDRGEDGWWNERTEWLIDRLREEVEEFAANPTWAEAADVANFAAMVADVAHERARYEPFPSNEQVKAAARVLKLDRPMMLPLVRAALVAAVSLQEDRG